MDRRELERARNRLTRDLPPIEGILRASLFERTLRCGKANCRCAKPGDPGHAVVCVSRSLPGGKNAQVTLPRKLVTTAESWIRNYQRWQEVVDEISAINLELLRRRWAEPPAGRRDRRR